MIRHPAYRADEVRGRILHDQLLAEAREVLETLDWPAPQDVPPLPIIAPIEPDRRLSLAAG